MSANSWWLSRPRDGFTKYVEQHELPRMQKDKKYGGFATFYGPALFPPKGAHKHTNKPTRKTQMDAV